MRPRLWHIHTTTAMASKTGDSRHTTPIDPYKPCTHDRAGHVTFAILCINVDEDSSRSVFIEVLEPSERLNLCMLCPHWEHAWSLLCNYVPVYCNDAHIHYCHTRGILYNTTVQRSYYNRDGRVTYTMSVKMVRPRSLISEGTFSIKPHMHTHNKRQVGSWVWHSSHTCWLLNRLACVTTISHSLDWPSPFPIIQINDDLYSLASTLARYICLWEGRICSWLIGHHDQVWEPQDASP